MTFRSRNAYYLRISSTVVLPLYLYLDDRHLDWMSDKVLQHVVSDLQPLFVPRHVSLASLGPAFAGLFRNFRQKETLISDLGLHQGRGAQLKFTGAPDFYQFAYFFRKIEPHSVVIKSRRFIAAPARPQTCPAPEIVSEGSRANQKRTRGAGQGSRKRRKTRVESESPNSPAETGEDNDISLRHGDNPTAPRRSQRLSLMTPGTYREEGDEVLVNDDDADSSEPLGSAHTTESLSPNEFNLTEQSASIEVAGETTAVGNHGDVDMSTEDVSQHEILGASEIDLTMGEDEEEEKPKPALRLNYQALNISGHCLCVVVEPWPSQHPTVPLRPIPPVSTALPSEASIGSGMDENISLQRGRTPLFLPEFDEATDLNRARPPVPLFDADPCLADDKGYDSDTLMNFSQVLNATGHTTVAFAEDDDDMEEAVLFGDADEVREFS